jgi:hypothetical protein
MYVLVPWKPVVLVWGLLSGMIFVSVVASSLLEGKDPFGPPAVIWTSRNDTGADHDIRSVTDDGGLLAP